MAQKIGNLAYTLARQILVKDKGGIASLPQKKEILSKVQDIFQMLKAGGYNPVSADKSIKSVNDLKKVLTDIEMKQQIEFNLSKNRSEGLETVLKKMDEGIPLNPGDQAKVEGVEKIADDEVLDAFKGFKPKIIQGGKSEGIEKLLKSGDVKKGVAPKTKTKDYKKIVELEEENMLADEARAKEFSDFSNRIKGMSSTDRVAERLKDLKNVNLSDLSGIEAQKIASEVIGRKGPFKTISNKGAKEVLGELDNIIKNEDLGTKLKNFDGDPDAMAMGGRIGFKNGLSVTDQGFFIDPYEGLSKEEKEKRIILDKIMSEKFSKKLSKEALEKIKIQQEIRKKQAEEMGLPEDMQLMNQGGRIGFDEGGPSNKGRRNFLKLMGGLASIPVFGKLFKAAKPAAKVAKTVEQSTGGVPAYFPKLVEKIKLLGDDVTRTNAYQERQVVTKYKDYEMTENLSTGNIEIEKTNEGMGTFVNMAGDVEQYDGIASKELISYSPPETIIGKNKKPVEVPAIYEESTVRSTGMDGKLEDFSEGLDSYDEILEEVGESKIKKAGGGLAHMLGE